MSKQEMEVWDISGILNSEDSFERNPNLEEEVNDFTEFLSERQINFIRVDCIIPETTQSKRFFRIKVGTIEGIEKTSKPTIVDNVFSLDSAVLESVEFILDGMSDKQKENTELLRRNLDTINDVLANSYNWLPASCIRAEN